MKKLLILVLVFFLFLHSNGNAQTIQPPQKMEVWLTVAPSDTSMHIGDTLFKANTHLMAKMVVRLNDTVNIKKVHVKLGTADGASDIFQYDFTFDSLLTSNNGISYIRKGSTLYLGLGSFMGLNFFYAEVKLEDFTGTLTFPVKYHKH